MGIGKRFGKPHLERLQQRLHTTAERAMERHLNLAVTGLSRSGKTVFITALCQHLLQADQTRSLPFLAVAAEDRLIGCRDLSQYSPSPFPLAACVDALSAHPPRWPDSTRGLSEVRLAIRYRRPAGLKRLLGEHATLYLNITDYPGEWLLDLPLLELSFAQWCQQQFSLFAAEPRASLAADWIDKVRQVDWQAPADVALLDALSLEFSRILQQLRQPPYNLSLLQPGQLAIPDSPPLPSDRALFPLPMDAAEIGAPLPGSNLHALQERYHTYLERQVRPFYQRHFSSFDRQIVLIDCLQTLNSGQACFEDMKTALNAILQSFDYGRSGFLRRLFSPRIDRVLFASTKADHVTANQHHNLDRFLELIIQDARREMRFEGVDTHCLALASIRSTEAAQTRLHGQLLSCLRGRSKDSGEEIALFPGEIPTELPGPDDWNQERFRFLDFAPRPLPRAGLQPEHHIRLDQALEFMIGDQFR